MARTSLPFLLMYFGKQEEGNMAGARHGPDSNAHGRIPFMPAHWRYRDNSAVGSGMEHSWGGGCRAGTTVVFAGGNCGPMRAFLFFILLRHNIVTVVSRQTKTRRHRMCLF